MTAPSTTDTIVPRNLADLKLVPPNWTWRTGQWELAEQIAQSTKKIVMFEAECGTGKSLIPTAAARATGKDAIVLIQTIQLQEQYLRDFIGLAMMVGRSHSECNLSGKSADKAPCTIGAKCSLKGMWVRGQPLDTPECNYFRRKAIAATSPITIQNYAYWLGETTNVGGSSFAKTDWIICDEAHELDQILMAAGVEEFRFLDLKEMEIPRPTKDYSVEQMVTWGNENSHTVNNRLAMLKQQARALGLSLPGDDEEAGDFIPDDDPDAVDAEFISHDDKVDAVIKAIHVTRRVKQGIDVLIDIDPDTYEEWVIDGAKDNSAVLLKPIYGKHAFKRILGAATEKIVLMSAFLGPELLMNTLGIDPEDVEIIRAPEAFDRSKSRIYYCPTRKLTYKTTANEYKYVNAVIGRFMDLYLDMKGMIHAPSVRLRDTILAGVMRPGAKQRFLAYDGDGPYRRFPAKDQILDTFVRSKQPNVLVGQSISTGVDLPYVPKWQIITKLWFLPTDDPAVVKRKNVDKSFYPYHTICQLVQAAGRIKRAQDHDGPTIILDEQFGWFFQSQKEHFPVWFRKALVYRGWDSFPDIKDKLVMDAMLSGLIINKPQ